jgi:hypothetical protein
MHPNLPCDFSSTARSQLHVTFNCRVYERYITKNELFAKLLNLKMKSSKKKEVCPTGLIVAEEKNEVSEYRAPHKFQIYIAFNDSEKVFQEEFYGELIKIIIEVQGPLVEIPEALFDSINDFDAVKEIFFVNIKKATDTIKIITEKDFKCRFRGVDKTQFAKIFYIYTWAEANKEDRIIWSKKINFIDSNKQKWGSEYIWKTLLEFKKIFDEENPPAPSTDYLDHTLNIGDSSRKSISYKQKPEFYISLD